MQFSVSNLIAFLSVLAIAVPSPTVDQNAATSPTPACVYSTLPSATAYAAVMPNPNLTAGKIENYFESFSFACKPGHNFTAYQLASPGSPWFGGDVQSSPNCTPGAFADLVDFAMQDGNNNPRPNVQCTQYMGATNTNFHKAANAYFASLK